MNDEPELKALKSELEEIIDPNDLITSRDTITSQINKIKNNFCVNNESFELTKKLLLNENEKSLINKAEQKYNEKYYHMKMIQRIRKIKLQWKKKIKALEDQGYKYRKRIIKTKLINIDINYNDDLFDEYKKNIGYEPISFMENYENYLDNLKYEDNLEMEILNKDLNIKLYITID